VTRHDGTERTVAAAAERPRMRRKLRRTGRRLARGSRGIERLFLKSKRIDRPAAGRRGGSAAGWLPAVEAEGLVAGAGLQAGADVADDLGGKAAHIVPADFAALAWFGVDGLPGPPRSGEKDADAGLPVGIGVVAQVGEGEVGEVDGDADFLEGFTSGCG